MVDPPSPGNRAVQVNDTFGPDFAVSCANKDAVWDKVGF